MRLIAGSCSGAACDWFIPVSLLLPVLILVMVGVTGVSAFNSSRRRPESRWTAAFGALTVLGVLGPIIALAIFRDSPDRFVLVATVLVALVPIAALAYAFTGVRTT